MTDFRALCAELVQDIEEWIVAVDHCPPSSSALVQRARAALSQPELQGPSDKEWDELWDEEAEYFALYAEARRFGRAVLARWGRPAIEPVPVSERLPGPEDCDPSFQCWWFTPSEEKWIFWPIKWASPECSHWLPHHALPVPGVEGKP
jgi:hypothetical protein